MPLNMNSERPSRADRRKWRRTLAFGRTGCNETPGRFPASECPSAGQQKARARSQDLQEQQEHRDAVQGGEEPAPRVSWRKRVDCSTSSPAHTARQHVRSEGEDLHDRAGTAEGRRRSPCTEDYGSEQQHDHQAPDRARPGKDCPRKVAGELAVRSAGEHRGRGEKSRKSPAEPERQCERAEREAEVHSRCLPDPQESPLARFFSFSTRVVRFSRRIFAAWFLLPPERSSASLIRRSSSSASAA